jgi:hypothetical protein
LKRQFIFEDIAELFRLAYPEIESSKIKAVLQKIPTEIFGLGRPIQNDTLRRVISNFNELVQFVTSINTSLANELTKLKTDLLVVIRKSFAEDQTLLVKCSSQVFAIDDLA